ncbi:MAG: hypothetical protein GQ576_03140 [Methanococcoides sp.]|nr:hypothetical protein [Methanococcoides sp.]
MDNLSLLDGLINRIFDRSSWVGLSVIKNKNHSYPIQPGDFAQWGNIRDTAQLEPL